jgi:predicted RNA polymerase sigma factor
MFGQASVNSFVPIPIPYGVPTPQELPKRLGAVLQDRLSRL